MSIRPTSRVWHATMLGSAFCLLGAAIVANGSAISELGASQSAEIVVGNNKKCCTKATWTKCSSVSPMACSNNQVSCDPNDPIIDRCSNATCSDTGDSTHNCSLLSNIVIDVFKCIPTSNQPIPCDNGQGQQCDFVLGYGGQVTFTKCGTSTLCANQPEFTCSG